MLLSNRSQRRLVLLLAAASLACATAPREGEQVYVAEEGAIIVWDAATTTQHFIRRASFETKAKDFGFLVPTPSVPDLAEADDAAFGLLEVLTRPPVVRQMAKSAAVVTGIPASAPQVVVVKQVEVAGYDVAVLAANDANALDQWLKKNGYASTPDLIDWYKPYLAKQWIISAFKIARKADSGGVRTSAVRMTFKTAQPFFPYREPKSADSSYRGRSLKIYYLGESRPEGKIGAGGAWPATLDWSGPVGQDDLDRLWRLLKLPLPRSSAVNRVTAFTDHASIRQGNDELWFSTAADQSPYPKEEVQKMFADLRDRERDTTWEWLVSLVAVLAAWAGYYWFRRLRANAGAKSKARQDPTSPPPSA